MRLSRWWYILALFPAALAGRGAFESLMDLVMMEVMAQDGEIGLDDDGMLASRLKNKTVAP